MCHLYTEVKSAAQLQAMCHTEVEYTEVKVKSAALIQAMCHLYTEVKSAALIQAMCH